MDSQTQQQLSSLSGVELGKKREWTVRSSREEESRPLIKRGFTEAQRKELEEQALINRHISAGLPVPIQLVLPIWKSVVTSLGSSNLSIYKHYPSFIGYILQGFDCRNLMDSEPRRCRRTDGKKWRCSREVISDQKYCERHIHRGRQRSRKLVEASRFASPPKPEKPKGEPTQNPGSNLSMGLQLMTPSSNDATSSHRIANSFSQKQISYVTSPFIASTATVSANSNPNHSISAMVTTSFASTKTGPNTPNDASGKRFGHNQMIRGGNNAVILARNGSTVLGFSPKSVLQVSRHHGLYIGNRTGGEPEPGRCRRTDGKKWRCRREVVPEQKYCPRHMHRGAKKLTKPFEPSPAVGHARPAPESCTGPNTNLCISVPTSPPTVSNDDDKSMSSTGSDTTISDTSIGAYVVSKAAS